jgi:adenosine kinase
VAVNDYEGQMLCDRVGWSWPSCRGACAAGRHAGAEGCDVWEDGVRTHVPAVEPQRVVDPTGCGDAWRGALLFGLEQGWPLARCAELGNRLGALKIAASGPQNYTVDRAVLLGEPA